MLVFDKDEIRKHLTLENVFELLQEWGGDPEYSSFGILSATICHNPPGEGSRKLYFYENSGLFRCYTGCDCYFDPFELVIKVAQIQWGQEYDLNAAVRWIAQRFGLSGTHEDGPGEDDLEDWKLLANYERIQGIELKSNYITLKEYEDYILDRFNYEVKIGPWLREGINQEALDQARIGFYPGADQITIPHFDQDGRFIGLRGRTLCAEEGERFGKYRPMKVNKLLYNHPLGMNLYNFNNSKPNITILGKAKKVAYSISHISVQKTTYRLLVVVQVFLLIRCKCLWMPGQRRLLSPLTDSSKRQAIMSLYILKLIYSN